MRLALVAATVTVAAVMIVLFSWLRMSNAALDQVSVVPDAMICDGKPVDYRIMTQDDPFFDGIPYPAFELSAGPGTECMLRVVVSNPGSRTVNLHNVSLPGMGVHASPMLRGVRLLETGDGPRRNEDSSDALFDLDLKLEPGGTQTLQFGLTYGAEDIDTDCRRNDYTEGIQGIPYVEVSRWGRHRTIEGAVSLVIHGKGSPMDECG